MIFSEAPFMLVYMKESCALNKPKDVILLKVAYPNEESMLNKIPHMYICIDIIDKMARYVKCQTHKPYHTYEGAEPIKRFIEPSNPKRNPFRQETLIDLDKIFVADKMRAASVIGQISEDFLQDILKAFSPDEAKIVNIR